MDSSIVLVICGVLCSEVSVCGSVLLLKDVCLCSFIGVVWWFSLSIYRVIV